MKKNKGSSNNSSFITNHQLIQWVKTKSSSQIHAPVSSCSTLSLIPKKQEAQNQFCQRNPKENNKNKKRSIQVDLYHQRPVQSIDQAISCIQNIYQDLKKQKQFRNICCKLESILSFLNSFATIQIKKQNQFFVQEKSVLDNTKYKNQQLQRLKWALNNEKNKNQRHYFTRNRQNKGLQKFQKQKDSLQDKKQNNNLEMNRKTQNNNLKILEQKVEQQNSKSKNNKSLNNIKDEKLHKIILKQSQIIERQQDHNKLQKQSLLVMLQSQAKTIQEYLHNAKFDIGASLKLSIDLDSYLLSSINQKDTNRY